MKKSAKIEDLSFRHPQTGKLHVLELLAFDLDGTVVDSKKDITYAVNATFQRYGVESLPEALIERYVGTGVRPLVEDTLIKAGITDLAKAVDCFQSIYQEHLTDNTELYPGIRDLLRHFEQYSSLQKVILTNKSNRFVGPLMQTLAIDKEFAAAYGRESFATHKPSPEPLQRIAEIHKVKVENILMIGDTDVDIGAGQNAGTFTCGVTYGYGLKETLQRLNPTFLIDTPAQLPGLLSGVSA